MSGANTAEIKMKNTTSVHSYHVLRQARYEHEKQLKGGKTFYESAESYRLEKLLLNFDSDSTIFRQSEMHDHTTIYKLTNKASFMTNNIHV